MTIRLLAAIDRAPCAWRNGGGRTSEIACSPQGSDLETFDWRISIADVSTAGPFSSFPGVDRFLSVLEGALALSIAGEAPELLTAASLPFAFSGDCPSHGTPFDGPARDLNVMVRRGKWAANVARIQQPGVLVDIDPQAATRPAATRMLVSTFAAATVVCGGAIHALMYLDALMLECDARLDDVTLRAATGGDDAALYVIALRSSSAD